ncbi:MAG: NADH-quinone oxidoreductase subunit C [Desulfurivibrionaceae bacterium]
MDRAKVQKELEALVPEGRAAAAPEEEVATGKEGKASEGEQGESEKKEEKEEKTREPGVLTLDHQARGFHLDVLLPVDQVVAAAEIMQRSGLTLEAVTGVDWIKQNKFEVIYDYALYDPGEELFRIVVRALVDRDQPDIPTVSGIFAGANWHERETWDLLGINFTGHPQLTRFLLPEDADFHPLRKDFKP